MKTILVTGGTSGIGKGIAMSHLRKGNRVIVVGHGSTYRDIFYNEVKKIGAEERALYIQANLGLVKENQRVVKEITSSFKSLDIIVFCAAKNSKIYTETQEGFELTFAIAYLSRFILSYGLKELLEKSENPVIINVCGSGMKGEVNWGDLQHKQKFDAQKVMFHSSRLNDLLGVQFAQNDTVGKIKYVMYNPWGVRTEGMKQVYNTPVKWMIFKMFSKPVDEAIIPLMELLDNPPSNTLSAYRVRKKLNIDNGSYNHENAKKLYNMTIKLVPDFKS